MGITYLKKFYFVLVIALVFFIAFSLLTTNTVHADYDITKGIAGAENIGCSGADCKACNLIQLGSNFISFLIYAGTVISALLFTYAGFKILTSGGDSGAITQARKIFWDVIVGFIIMISAWLLVDTIMKSLLSDEYTEFGPWNEVACISSANPPPPPPPPPPGSTSSEKCTRDALAAAGIGINKGACPTPQSTNCTSVSGLPRQAVDGLIRFKNSCTNCGPITLTGGTEAGHATHGVGRPIIDIDDNPRIISYLEANGTKSTNRRGESVYKIGGNTFTYETNPSHVHMVFEVTERTPYMCQ